jgi:hypothetical protein
MERETQISAAIAPAVKEMLDRHVRATGVKKGHLIQEALLHHLAALEALPADAIIPTRIVVDRASGKALLRRLASPAKPSKALRELMRG